MKQQIDIVGHFGTRFSYATIGSHLARALRRHDLLGSVVNLDPAWHDDHADLCRAIERKGSHVVVLTAPHHYMEAYPTTYGRERSAIFACPNTDRLSAEHAETCKKFGEVLVPSTWCANVLNDVGIVPMMVTLGVDERLLETREQRRLELRRRLSSPPYQLSLRERITTFVHFSTDQWWPGRKGTEELLDAWASRWAGELDGWTPHMVLHVPPALQRAAWEAVRERDIDNTVEVVLTGSHGDGDGGLLSLFDRADAIVAPSRCEGFGIMLLSAIVAGVPLVCTANTGHWEYLSMLPGWLGVPSSGPSARLAGEEGMAPVVDVRALTTTLGVAALPEARARLLDDADSVATLKAWTWPAVMDGWVIALSQWLEETG